MYKFSALYRKMCEKAEVLQKNWSLKPGDWHCERGDYRDDFGEEFIQKDMSKEEMEDFKSSHVWLPKKHNIDRLLHTGIQGQNNLTVDRFYNEFLKDKGKEIKNSFKDKVDDIINVEALIFYMEYEFGMEWDYKKQEWVDIKKR